ncbi:MAG TPA: hypothetical protein VEC60_10735, partial [Reyranella sp.]|nr:hypothetical protein [Reyranella sp.]
RTSLIGRSAIGRLYPSLPPPDVPPLVPPDVPGWCSGCSRKAALPSRRFGCTPTEARKTRRSEEN